MVIGSNPIFLINVILFFLPFTLSSWRKADPLSFFFLLLKPSFWGNIDEGLVEVDVVLEGTEFERKSKWIITRVSEHRIWRQRSKHAGGNGCKYLADPWFNKLTPKYHSCSFFF